MFLVELSTVRSGKIFSCHIGDLLKHVKYPPIATVATSYIQQMISWITSGIRSTPSVMPHKTHLRPWFNHVRRRLLMSSGQPHHPRSRRSSWARQTSNVCLIRRQLSSLSDCAQCCLAWSRASATRHSSKVCCRRARSTPSSDRGGKSPQWILTTWTPTDPSPTRLSYRRPSNEWWQYASMNTWKRTICCHHVSPRTTHTILPKPPWSTSTTEWCAIWTVADMPVSWSCSSKAVPSTPSITRSSSRYLRNVSGSLESP